MLMIASSGMALVWPEGTIMAQGRRQRVIMAAQRSIPWPYRYKQILTYLLIGFYD